jgi:hypothetical protein
VGLHDVVVRAIEPGIEDAFMELMGAVPHATPEAA